MNPNLIHNNNMNYVHSLYCVGDSVCHPYVNFGNSETANACIVKEQSISNSIFVSWNGPTLLLVYCTQQNSIMPQQTSIMHQQYSIMHQRW